MDCFAALAMTAFYREQDLSPLVQIQRLSAAIIGIADFQSRGGWFGRIPA
jgi:hypothetical protein